MDKALFKRLTAVVNALSIETDSKVTVQRLIEIILSLSVIDEDKMMKLCSIAVSHSMEVPELRPGLTANRLIELRSGLRDGNDG
jgi:hypothetical protein